MRIYRRDQPLPPIPEQKMDQQVVDTEAARPARRFIDPCDILFKPMLGEFLGTLFLDFFAAQLLVFATENFVMAALCTGLLRYTLMRVFEDCCSGEFNPAISIGKLFCLERSLLISLCLISGQLFGAFIGEVLFAAVRPATAQVFPYVFLNETDVFVDRLPSSFQSYFLIEMINTAMFVVTYLRTEHSGCMAAVTTIAITLAYNAGLETRATGNIAQIVAHSLTGTLWVVHSNPWRYVEAASAATFIAPVYCSCVILASSFRQRHAK
ncbi:Aquaporin-8 [Aphelenchoides bicaudatus]|nr:Aquaporin-8 [Aphelenchoides bicaudatus]